MSGSAAGASRQKRFRELAHVSELFEAIDEIDQRVASAGTKRFLREIEAASKFREMLLAREATRGTSQHDSAAPAVPSFSVMTTSCGTNAFGCMPVDITRDTRNVG